MTSFVRRSFLAEDGRLRPGWRFVISALLVYGVIFFAANIAVLFHPTSFGQFEALYRPLMALLLLCIFDGLARSLNGEDETFASFGLGIKRPWLREFSIGLGMGTVLLALALGIVAIFGSYHAAVDRTESVLLPLATQLWILITGALVEELAFRGYPFQQLVESVGSWQAVVVASIFFGAIHYANPGISRLALINTLLFGVFLSVVFLQTRSLWIVWGIHFGWNFVMGVVLGLPVSGLNEFSVLVKGTATGSRWLTGGDYGIEGSITCLIVLLAGILLISRPKFSSQLYPQK